MNNNIDNNTNIYHNVLPTNAYLCCKQIEEDLRKPSPIHYIYKTTPRPHKKTYYNFIENSHLADEVRKVQLQIFGYLK